MNLVVKLDSANGVPWLVSRVRTVALRTQVVSLAASQFSRMSQVSTHTDGDIRDLAVTRDSIMPRCTYDAAAHAPV